MRITILSVNGGKTGNNWYIIITFTDMIIQADEWI